MQLRAVADCLACQVLSGKEQLDREVALAFAADLMSDVLAHAPQGALLLTGLATAQSVHTAEIADMCGVVIVGNKRPASEVIAFARQRGLLLLLTPHSLFEACGLLFARGLRSALPDEIPVGVIR